jgi:hypothetical protein
MAGEMNIKKTAARMICLMDDWITIDKVIKTVGIAPGQNGVTLWVKKERKCIPFVSRSPAQ